MDASGRKPANPFSCERQFEESLHFEVNPIPGHQGRFCASHAHLSIGKVIEYQKQRKARTWIPGISSSGRPNDYINLFLEEIKIWCKEQLTLDSVSLEELEKRKVYFQKLKHDKYYWCFPQEADRHLYHIHDVIDFVHNKVCDALEIVKREKKNKSLQELFKELNDHTTNTFEYGKSFLAYILCAKMEGGADLRTSKVSIFL